MAQLPNKQSFINRAGLVLKQRPHLLFGIVIACAIVTGSLAYGVVQAQASGGFSIDTSNNKEHDTAEVDEDESSEQAVTPKVFIDVSGAVANPGVFELDEDARVQDAIAAAGGLSADADVSLINRASKVVDGQQVYVPRIGESANQDAAAASSGGSGASSQSSGLVNINRASVSDLDALPGVGPSTAQAIVDDRNANGPFVSIEDLMRVTGIGQKKFDKLKNSICV